ncbi:excinuclease ABC subunit UvrA [soil metagenome]
MNEQITEHEVLNVDDLDPKHFIIIKGARVNNLKNINVAIPRNKLVVITGLSGSGKSSLAFDTLFAEGQRMYVESLSSYARQFLGRMEKPEVEYIKGISPAIAIEQKVSTRNSRSTVGTTTEIYDYLKLLFSRIGITYSPVSGERVKRDTVSDVVNFLLEKREGTKLLIHFPLFLTKKRNVSHELNILLQKGFTRVLVENQVVYIEDMLDDPKKYKGISTLHVLVDRATIQHTDKEEDQDLQFRLADSVQTAFFEGEGTCLIDWIDNENQIKRKEFSDKFEMDGISFEEPSVNLFSFNNPYGACKTCEGFGKVLGIDEDLVIPDKNISVYEGAIAPWRSEGMRVWLEPLLKNGIKFDFPIHRSYYELNDAEKQLLWNGNSYFEGLNQFFSHLESKAHKIQYRVLLSRYRGRTTCPDCRGSRLRKDASYVKINHSSITDLVLMPIENVIQFFQNLKISDSEYHISKRILVEISSRLDYLDRVGLGYLSLNRISSTLSGGEYQRIKLATSLGSALVGSMYILDEPSIGLHPRDTNKLISILKSLRDLGNTVIVVEHEEEIMRSADQIIDIGPEAGANGGHLIFQGNLESLKNFSDSYTARYLNNIDLIHIPKTRRSIKDKIEIVGAKENNLKSINVSIPLHALTVVTGVSGSGKSTLIKKILYPSIGKIVGTVSDIPGKFDKLEGDYQKITSVEFVDQNPIGKSSRSNPVTYVKAYDAIRQLYSEQNLSKQRGYKPSHFSFNVDGGRCEMCQGEGTIQIEMQFMADIHLTCESCQGKRFKQEILEVTYKDKNISDVLDMTLDESLDFFKGKSMIVNKLLPLQEVGLGYITLGQSSSSLSGGEAQRVKLASFLSRGGNRSTRTEANQHILFIFDEPATGLHFHDIKKLLKAIQALVDQGNTAVIIEHNLEIIKSADWIIDLGPEGGEKGGEVTFAGRPEDLIKLENNYTAYYLKEKF